MAKPSLNASSEGTQLAEHALTRAGWTQKHLMTVVGCSKQPITKFFKGEAITQDIFMRICDRLGLNWQEIAGLSALPGELPLPSSVQVSSRDRNELNDLVHALRQRVHASIRERCGTMRVLDMSHPIEVNDIYTSVNILEQITGRRYKSIDELLQEYDPENLDRFGLGQVAEERIPGLAAVQHYQKLILLGKPGAGKTTFLKYLAIQCNEGSFEPERVPIFVSLKGFAEAEDKPGLLEYISCRDTNYYLPVVSPDLKEQWMTEFYQLFHRGKALVLLDGLDEVREEDHYRVIKEIRDFSEQFWQNHFVMTCRIAAWEYIFEKFTEVEVADFDQEQIIAFAEKWFKPKPIKASTFLRHLAENPRIQQLAVSPLLLTLVCLAFEETGDCPSSRSELYREGIDALLKKWDAKRGIHRDQVYKKLSHQRKEDLLSQLALTTFRQKDYLFKQAFAEQFIATYIRNLTHSSSDPEELRLDAEVILQSIEAQHGLLIERAKGIYSFSHLTFHEYFAARELIFSSSSLDTALEELLLHVTDRRWREIFLLAAEMLRDAALLLIPMQRQADDLLSGSDKLQKFLLAIRDQAKALEFSHINPAAVRAFYFDVDFDIDENRSVALGLDRSANWLVCASFLTRMWEGMTLEDAIAVTQRYDATVTDPEAKITAATSANAVMLIAIKIALDSKKLETSERKTLNTLLGRFNNPGEDDEAAKQLADEARAVAKSKHHIGQEWNFSDQEKKRLRRYYYTVQLLVECLNSSGCMLAPEVRQGLINNLFLPVHP